MIGNVSQTSASGAYDMASASLGKQDFLQLLVAQLQQQDPLNPQDGAQFVAQLAQFSSVEQLMNIGTGMDTLAMAQQAATSAQVVGFIGRDVVSLADVSNASVDLAEPPGVSFSLNGATQSVTVEIVDGAGKTVRTIEAGNLESGSQTIAFDGRDSGGALLDPEANYSARVMGRDRVVGVTYESGYPELLLDSGGKVRMADIVRVEDGATPSASGGSTVMAGDILPPSVVAEAMAAQGGSLSASAGSATPGSLSTPLPVEEERVEPALSDYIQRMLGQL